MQNEEQGFGDYINRVVSFQLVYLGYSLGRLFESLFNVSSNYSMKDVTLSKMFLDNYVFFCSFHSTTEHPNYYITVVVSVCLSVCLSHRMSVVQPRKSTEPILMTIYTVLAYTPGNDIVLF